MLSLRPYQQAAVTAIYNYFAEKNGHPLVVIPTAGGKSIVLASFIQGVLQQWPDQRILVVTHVRELIAQNHAEMLGLWPKLSASRRVKSRSPLAFSTDCSTAASTSGARLWSSEIIWPAEKTNMPEFQA